MEDHVRNHDVQGDADRFKWHGMRQEKILRKIDEMLEVLQLTAPSQMLNKCRLAISVVVGDGVDWNHELGDWLKDGGT